MSWTDNVNWQQLNRDLQNIEMLRLQQEQNELLKKAAEKPRLQPGRSLEEIDAEIFRLRQNAELKSFETLDPDGFTEMGEWWYDEGQLAKALSSYLNAATLCFIDEPVPGWLCHRIADIAEELGNTKFAKIWFERGAEVSHAASACSLIWSYLIPEKQWDEIAKLIADGAANDAGEQTTNLFSNGAIALYMQGKVDQAIELFEKVLDRRDHFSDDEAHWWLSRIYSERGDERLTAKHLKKSQKAGDYTPPEWL